jgi:hypothetical protein
MISLVSFCQFVTYVISHSCSNPLHCHDAPTVPACTAPMPNLLMSPFTYLQPTFPTLPLTPTGLSCLRSRTALLHPRCLHCLPIFKTSTSSSMLFLAAYVPAVVCTHIYQSSCLLLIPTITIHTVRTCALPPC